MEGTRSLTSGQSARALAMAQTVGDFIVERLHAWGVRKDLRLSGRRHQRSVRRPEPANGKISSSRRATRKWRRSWLLPTPSSPASWASASRPPGPGASHLVTGLYDARLDHMPVLAITGQQSRNALGGHYQQEVDLPSLFKDVAGAFVQQASSAPQVRHMVDRAIRVALGERRVTAIILPNDLQEADYEEPPRLHGTLHSGVGFSKPRDGAL